MFVRLTLFIFLFTAVLASSPGLGFAQVLESPRVSSKWGHITSLETGWADDTMSVWLDVPFVNSGEVGVVPASPSGFGINPCPTTNAGYALEPKDPGVKVHEAALLGAFLAGKQVKVLVQHCSFGKPRIIAVGIQ